MPLSARRALIPLTLAAASWSFGASAQPPPAAPPSAADPGETVKAKTATTGKTDIAKGGFVTTTPVNEDDPKTANDVSLGLGGMFAAGNARTVALTSLARARFRRDEHQLSVAGTFNFARTGKKGESIDTTVENIQGLLRYDYFLSNDVSLFLQSTARRDRFQGLDLRLNIDPGVAYYFINTKTHRFQIEGGYDLQHDVRRDESRAQPLPAGSPAGTPPLPLVDKTKTLHNSRLLLAYENKLRKEVALVVSIEYLQNFSDFETYRLITDIGLKSNVSTNLALATTYTARYENKPLPTVVDLDSIASVNLVYSFF
jgi:putative salt-induced outer membrane protein